MNDSGRRMYRNDRTISVQKLPMVLVFLRFSPRIKASRTAIPTAALIKFWTDSPNACVK